MKTLRENSNVTKNVKAKKLMNDYNLCCASGADLRFPMWELHPFYILPQFLKKSKKTKQFWSLGSMAERFPSLPATVRLSRRDKVKGSLSFLFNVDVA